MKTAAHQPAKPHNAQDLTEMIALLESLAANETPQSPAMERFIETLHGGGLGCLVGGQGFEESDYLSEVLSVMGLCGLVSCGLHFQAPLS